jgi:hypothetical protein
VDAAEVMPAARPSATYEPMGAMPLVLFAAAVFSCAVATAAPATAPAMFPDPDLQTQLQRVAEIPEREEPVARYAEAIKLREMVGNREQDYEKLILNIAYFAKGGPSNVHSSGKTYVYHYLCRVLDLNRPAVLAALLPHLASDDVSLRQFLHSDVIWGVESLPGAEGAAEYVSFVRMRPNQVCGALLHELYQKDLEAALLGLGSVYIRDPATARALIWSAHVITEAHWRWEHHFANSAELEPALVELRRIATSPEAWQRLYVAEVLTQWRDFVDADLLAKLREDADPTVRNVAGRSPPPKPPPWPGHVPESR